MDSRELNLSSKDKTVRIRQTIRCAQALSSTAVTRRPCAEHACRPDLVRWSRALACVGAVPVVPVLCCCTRCTGRDIGPEASPLSNGLRGGPRAWLCRQHGTGVADSSAACVPSCVAVLTASEPRHGRVPVIRRSSRRAASCVSRCAAGSTPTLTIVILPLTPCLFVLCWAPLPHLHLWCARPLPVRVSDSPAVACSATLATPLWFLLGATRVGLSRSLSPCLGD